MTKLHKKYPEHMAIDRPCPKCAGELRVINKTNQQQPRPQFIGCSSWPCCGFRLTFSAEIVRELDQKVAAREPAELQTW